MAENTAEELERFRQRWQEEVTARSKGAASSSELSRPAQSLHSTFGTSQHERTAPPTFHRPYRDIDETNNVGEHWYHDLEDRDETRKLAEAGEGTHPSTRREPSSALEHYERAVERESEGSLGDSLNLYRRAFKLDAAVDRLYKNKHFPPSSFKSKSTNQNSSNAAVTVLDPTHHSPDGPPTSTSQLIASFSSLSIPSAEPPTEGSPPPPCPISTIPSETLINILLQVGLMDIASFAQLSLVCKRLAYLVATEHRIWERVCLGSEIGFAAMHYKWACSISGGPLPISLEDLDTGLSNLGLKNPTIESLSDTFSLSPAYSTYQAMLHHRPRVRFDGCYISTVNYIRPGGNTASQVSLQTPVHIVTYYRYLRFFRDGTCASLLTTTEPPDVVHHLTKANMHTHHPGGLPSSVMNAALRGRWRLSGDPYKPPSAGLDHSEKENEEEEEGTLHIETEGADAGHQNPKYIYKMALQLKSARKGYGATRNNKLVWMGYWSYNKLTDDWAEFGLRNDKNYVWSRVKSYGSGE
ncbi:F-box protein 9, partial [Lecanoromycetidae sp. Uapishka_2]